MFTIVATLNQSRKVITPDYYPRCFGMFDTQEEARRILDGLSVEKSKYGCNPVRINENLLGTGTEMFEIVEILPLRPFVPQLTRNFSIRGATARTRETSHTRKELSKRTEFALLCGRSS